jgi:signal peptidase II
VNRDGGRLLDLSICVAVVVADQVTKALVREALPLHSSVTIIPGFLSFTHVTNTGAAFGILNSVDFPGKALLILAVALLALTVIGVYALRLPPEEKLARRGLALILGGAIGNLIDRSLAGHVLDFVDAYWGEYHFWAFNVADAAITIGAALTILQMLLGTERHVPKTV